ncbi:MAG TPA: hypothetical protein VE398_26360 [Acidobacteriota bacterium]|nr:hypothetical protein [Acidobacteriota bacterium]
MHSFRLLTIVALSVVVLAPARTGVAQQRPGIRAQVIAPEGCSISGPVDTEDMYYFISTQIQALSFARAGERAGFRTSAAGGDTPLRQVPNFAGLKEERIDNTCAGFLLSPYASSKIEGVATVAKYLVFAYDELAKMSDEMLGITLRGAYAGPSTRVVELSNWNRRRQEILSNMTDAVNLSLSLLIRTDAEGKPSDLILSREERHSLLSYLNSEFPVGGNPGAIGYSGDFVKQAAMIRSFLSGGYKFGN